MKREYTVRKRFFVHPSIQFKYILLSIIPALIIGIFCSYFLVATGELILLREKAKTMVEVSYFNEILPQLTREEYPREVILKVVELKRKLISFQSSIQEVYLDTIEEWTDTKNMILQVIFMVIVGTSLLALSYSHRVVGPVNRLQKYVEMLAEGKDVPPIRVRADDEFKDIASSLDRLRKMLKEKGILK